MRSLNNLTSHIVCSNKNWVPIYWTDCGWCAGGDYEHCPCYTDEEIDTAEVLEYSTYGGIIEARLDLD